MTKTTWVRALQPHRDKLQRKDRRTGDEYPCPDDSARRRERHGLVEILGDLDGETKDVRVGGRVVGTIADGAMVAADKPGPKAKPGPTETKPAAPAETKTEPETNGDTGGDAPNPAHAKMDELAAANGGDIANVTVSRLKRLALEDFGLDEEKLEGTGSGGRLVKDDWVLAIREARGT